MARLLLALNWALVKAGFKRSVSRAIGTIFGYFLSLWFGAMILLGLLGLRFVSAEIRGAASVLALSVITLVWVIGALLVFGHDQTMDPGRFALFPIRARQLMPGLLLIGLLGGSGLIMAGILGGLIVAFSTSVVGTVLAIVGGIFGILTILLVSRVLIAAFTKALASRRLRDIAVVALGLSGMAISLVVQSITSITSNKNPEQMRGPLLIAGQIAGWSPCGWAWSLPADAEAGRWLALGIKALLAAGLIMVLWFGWAHYLDRALTSPLEAGGQGDKVGATSIVDKLFPATSTGAIAARTLRYWRRDPRHLLLLAIMIMMPLMMLGPAYLNGRGEVPIIGLLGAAPIMAMMVGSIAASETAYDGSALWTHIVSGITGATDRRGRAWATSVLCVPIIVIGWFVSASIVHRWDLAVGALGVTAALIGAGLGAGLWASTIWSQSQPPPGSSPFAKQSGSQWAGLIQFAVVSMLTFFPALPTVALAVAAYRYAWLAWVALLVGVLTGLLGAWLGIRIGGRSLDRRWPEVLKMVTYKS